MTYNDKVIFPFVVLPHKPHFQTETWIRAIGSNNYLLKNHQEVARIEPQALGVHLNVKW